MPQFANAEKCSVRMRQIIGNNWQIIGKSKVEETWLILFFQKQKHLE